MKLDRYGRGRMASDRQWEDIKNVLKTNPNLSVPYGRDFAKKLGLSEPADPAFREASGT
jgi:hypothetical protein